MLKYVKAKRVTQGFSAVSGFLTDFDHDKKYALLRKNRIQRKFRKRNQSMCTAITSKSFLVSKQVLRCQKDD